MSEQKKDDLIVDADPMRARLIGITNDIADIKKIQDIYSHRIGEISMKMASYNSYLERMESKINGIQRDQMNCTNHLISFDSKCLLICSTASLLLGSLIGHFIYISLL